MRNVCLLIGVGLLSVACATSTTARERAKGKDGTDRRPGGAPAAFDVHSFGASNGRTLRYSLFTPKRGESNEKLPLVLCLHGAGGNTTAADVLVEPARQQK